MFYVLSVLFLLFLVLGIKPRSSQMLSKHYSAELHPHPPV